MNSILKIANIEHTVFLKKKGTVLQQKLLLTLENKGSAFNAWITMETEGKRHESQLGPIPHGSSSYEIFIDEPEEKQNAVFVLRCGDEEADRWSCTLVPPKHWIVHVVQLSHHDPGYTDLPSLVLKDHCKWLDAAIDMAEETDSHPDDSKFRIVVEQAWSIDHYIKNAPGHRTEKIGKLLKDGRFEIAALFGNMTSELCGHETLARTLYHAFRLKRRYGCDIISAEHNDITGISWGLSRVLTDAGIKIFCPGIPLYYNWGKQDLSSFWDQKAIFGSDGPGAFWWEAPSGKKVLFWCNNTGCGGPSRGCLPGLAEKLQQLNGRDYPYSVLRWPLGGGDRDNSPYIIDYAYTIKDWNEKWIYPKLVCSTNKNFYKDFIKEVEARVSPELPLGLPVFRGELAGQDYPLGAVSTAAATAANRRNHSSLPAAERLAAVASLTAGHEYPADNIFDAYEGILWHDEHAWGYHFPAGPAMAASEAEKAVHALRTEAIAHGVLNKAMARLADSVMIDGTDIHLVVFNNAPYDRTAPMHAQLRELDNSGSIMFQVPAQEDREGIPHLRGVLLNDRFHINPDIDLVDGKFDLIDNETCKKVPFQIIEIESAMDTVRYAGQKLGLGEGSRRYGFFEIPAGIKREICFIAENVSGMGFRTYRLVPRESGPVFENRVKAVALSEQHSIAIENEFYLAVVDGRTGAVASIFDKAAGRELVDRECRHGFNTVIVRKANSPDEMKIKCTGVRRKYEGPVCAALEINSSVQGHPVIVQTVRLYTGAKQIFLETRVLKDATPLLNVHLAFPFMAQKPEFRYEGGLSVMNPVKDYLPASQSDAVAVQNWVKVSDGGYSILWSSLDAPIADFGGLNPGYTSPAHRCVFEAGEKHLPIKQEDLKKGWLYSEIFSNNFGTNFSVSQVCDVLFRYTLTTSEDALSDGAAAAFGWKAVTPMEAIYTRKFENRERKNLLPAAGSFIHLDNPDVALIAFKKAEDGDGYVLRLWNMEKSVQSITIRLPYFRAAGLQLLNLVEEPLESVCKVDGDFVRLDIAADSVITLKLTGCSGIL